MLRDRNNSLQISGDGSSLQAQGINFDIDEKGVHLKSTDPKVVNNKDFVNFMNISASNYLQANDKMRQKLIEEGKKLGRQELDNELSNAKF